MFDDVSGRYDFLNRMMTLGQDGAWRDAMWRAVPSEAHIVLDLCTGSGVSLPGLRRPGRIVLGMDVSFAMLEVAQERQGRSGWAPRLACADAFHLPVRAAALDAVTIAFGVRNLRPRTGAFAELARAIRPGGTLVILEASAPAPGPLQPFHALWVRHVIPLAGHLSPDPSAYRYLSQSIFEFGWGPELLRDLRAAGFELEREKTFLLGATRLWVARRSAGPGKDSTAARATLHSATAVPGVSPHGPAGTAASVSERRTWLGLQGLVSAVLTLALGWALFVWAKLNAALPLTALQRRMGWVLLGVGLLAFGARTLWLGLRWGAAEESH